MEWQVTVDGRGDHCRKLVKKQRARREEDYMSKEDYMRKYRGSRWHSCIHEKNESCPTWQKHSTTLLITQMRIKWDALTTWESFNTSTQWRGSLVLVSATVPDRRVSPMIGVILQRVSNFVLCPTTLTLYATSRVAGSSSWYQRVEPRTCRQRWFSLQERT